MNNPLDQSVLQNPEAFTMLQNLLKRFMGPHVEMPTDRNAPGGVTQLMSTFPAFGKEQSPFVTNPSPTNKPTEAAYNKPAGAQVWMTQQKPKGKR